MALELMKQGGHELPFIIVSGTISEETAAAREKTKMQRRSRVAAGRCQGFDHMKRT